MTYSGLFAKCRTVGECRRMKVTQLDKATSNIQRLEIEKAYKERVWEIRDSHKEGCFG